MEENVAILMADLSGYTALTEIHGSYTAADLIDQYIDIVNECLLPDCHLHERVGDEVMIVSSSPRSLLTTATRLIQSTSSLQGFLQIHGGLHFGKLLKRNSSYFGNALNLTARLAAKANPGTFWCSADFINALGNRYRDLFISGGLQQFKNISSQKEVFELITNISSPGFIDPVCRMQIQDLEKTIHHPVIHDLHFCSETCLDIYNHIY